jgi:imidazolonepropionase-like amidohydrolase
MRKDFKSILDTIVCAGLGAARQRLRLRQPSAAFQTAVPKAAEGRRTPKAGAPLFTAFIAIALWSSIIATAFSADSTLLYNATVHTGTGETFTNSGVLIESNKISLVLSNKNSVRLSVRDMIDLHGQHIYPGLIALDSALGLTEIDAVRSTQDAIEVGDYTPDVESWVAVNPDSELLPVARANGIAYFEPIPGGSMVTGQSALLAMRGWTYEQMLVKKPVALHVIWPDMDLNTTPKEKSRDKEKWKSLEDQAKERRAKLAALADFFDEAKAYAKAKDAATNGSPAPERIPAWEAMLRFARGELPLVIHADEVRQIKSAAEWAATNKFKIAIAGGRDAWMLAGLLATNHIPVVYEHTFTQPSRDTDSYDVQFHAPEVLRAAGVKVIFSQGPGGFGATMARNLPYAAAQAIAFGLPEPEALRGITLYPAQLMGVADQLGTIEPGKQATLIVCDGDIFDIRSNVKRMWIAGQEVSLESRHTKLYERYKNRPKPQ